jgi:DNA-binding MarR family transcriptional regulator
MSTVRRTVAEHNSSRLDEDSAELHGLLMELVRATGLLQADLLVPGQAVSISQAFALHELDTDRPLSQRDLADRLNLDKSSVSRMAADLERRGLIARERDPDNRRFYRLRITPEGRALHARMRGTFHERNARWVAELTGTEREAVRTGLAALIRVIRAHWHPSPPNP